METDCPTGGTGHCNNDCPYWVDGKCTPKGDACSRCEYDKDDDGCVQIICPHQISKGVAEGLLTPEDILKLLIDEYGLFQMQGGLSRWVSDVSRIVAKAQRDLTRGERLPDRDKIAKICGDAKYADGVSVGWEYYGDYEKGLAFDKADQILALKGEKDG